MKIRLKFDYIHHNIHWTTRWSILNLTIYLGKLWISYDVMNHESCESWYTIYSEPILLLNPLILFWITSKKELILFTDFAVIFYSLDNSVYSRPKHKAWQDISFSCFHFSSISSLRISSTSTMPILFPHSFL